jgi:hypothetical protein
MGVQIYLLDRRIVTLLVAGRPTEIGTLRRFWKITEVDSERQAEIDKAKAVLQGKPAPLAVMVVDVTEVRLAATPSQKITAHLVLGWDADRYSVTDLNWEYMPILGYAVRSNETAQYVLHKEREGVLSPISSTCAIELGFLNQMGQFLRRGQPSIVQCRSVRPYISIYAQADCVLSNGEIAEILTSIEPREMPEAAWYIGKRPVDVTRYPPLK